MNAEIIAIGSELLLGQIANTNAQFISKQLAQIGINVFYHTVVGDNANRLTEAIKIAQKRANLIIFTGGLGPTKDDLTKETIATVLGHKLVHNEEVLERIEAFFKQRQRVMTPNNRKQAIVIEGSQVLPNDFGMAPGMAFCSDKIHYMLFPGPPKELQPMFVTYGLKYLQLQLNETNVIFSKVLRFFDIGESQLETEIEDLLDQQTNPTIAPLAGNGEVTLRITAKHSSQEVAEKLVTDMEQLILGRVGEYFYGYNDTSLPEKALEILSEKKMTIASAESLTGGLFGQSTTNFPGSSVLFNGGIVCYTNEVKRDVLRISEQLLETKGAVSSECAKQLAENVRSLQSDVGISFTGVAGPAKSEGKEIGTVFVAIAIKDRETVVFPLKLAGTRYDIRNRTVKYGFYYLLKELKKVEMKK